MTLIMNVPTTAEETKPESYDSTVPEKSTDELTIRMESIHEQHSAMNEDQKAEKRSLSPSLYSLLQKTLESKGEYPLEKSEWSVNNELVVEGLSEMTLHTFLLKAESLGKKITYTKSMKIKISD